MFEIIQIAVLPHNANYNYILHGEGETVIVDPSLSAPIIDVLKEKGWRADKIINTHHHWDHTDGNMELKEFYNAKVIGFLQDAHRIPGIDIFLNEGDEIQICGEKARIMFLPGHTTGHIAYYFEELDILFSGDVIFAMGCGRLFEGTYEQAYESLQKIVSLPPHTKIYCAHEYTLTNGKFVRTIDPKNEDVKTRMQITEKLRAQNIPTIPTTVETELKTNPFVRAKSVGEFEKIRKARDRF
ncbi:MAG: hydroxyacylglutathione hydrolase [Rickettsiales bacterium]|nr:hydroxyacylglutathione hydrolase [Pseudomonadota bacterium]MDA0965736.1 hydroxyacylglutathione hydrolase [Pseudomonadota bacterium]MDG4543802.1 hydroxyacylglutathione hydrolase [Rickettsiales bacterium]MDG4545949.1 hydroxyacylglutathione hydrolase [Rickettsiales bacterium]MDG4548195.1 hydroxyacylglutathione hydrolase [Rickettsiales bacterium]